MKALKCDVCGGYYDCSNNSSIVTGFAYLNRYEGLVGDKIDICPECYKAIKKALDDREKLVITDPNEDDLK